MKIFYVADTSLENKSAYSHHVIKMCDAFGQLNNNVTLVLPNERLKYFNKNLKTKFLLNSKKPLIIKSIMKTGIKNFINRFFFGYKSSLYLKKMRGNLIIIRSMSTSIFLSIFKIAHFLEIHAEQKSLTKFILINLNFINSKHIIKIIMISKSLSKLYRINKEKILILHDGVDIKNFKKSKIKTKKKIETATYIGSFYEGRGIEIIIELARHFKKIRFNLYGDMRNFKKNYFIKNLNFKNYVNYNMVPQILSKSDILLMPYSNIVHVRSDNLNTANYCSPLKMFDYLASGKLIFSSKLDGICEVLKNDKNSVIVNKYRFDDWKRAISSVFSKSFNYNKISTNAISTAKLYTWNKRVSKITEIYNNYLKDKKNA